MSSLRIRTKNKLLTVLGAAKPSTNVAYDLAYSDFESTLQRLVTLDTALKSYGGLLRTFHGAASSVTGAIESLSSGGTGTASYHQKTSGTSEVQQFAGEARVACADLDLLVLQEASNDLEHNVLTPVRGWLHHARSLQTEVAEFLEKKELYDHYSRKVASLREAHEKRSSQGRVEKAKHTERMFRNEQKLAATTQEYTRVSDTVIRDLRAFVMSRDAALAPLLRRMLRNRVLYADRMHEATGRIRSLIDDGVEENEDGVLAQFATVAQNGGHIGSDTIMAAAIAPLPMSSTVRKSSFEEFVGEAPKESLATWDAFASPLPEQDVAPMGRFGSEPNYTPPHAVPQFMTVDATTSRSWCDFTTPAGPSGTANPWESCPHPSAPLADPFPPREWAATTTGQNTLQQHSFTIVDFPDMHANALGSSS